LTDTTVVLTVYDRPRAVLSAVLDSLEDQGQQATIIVLDRPEQGLADWIRRTVEGRNLGEVKLPEIVGGKGWRCPAKAWNVGLARVDTRYVYCISSEVIQEPGNVERATNLLGRMTKETGRRAILFGKAECSCGPEGKEVDWNGAAPGNLLVDAEHPRPLGFILAGPRESFNRIGGYDEGFMAGLWYDDDDLVFRLWQDGNDFLFDNSVSGVHQHHERPELFPSRVVMNHALMMSKHGHLSPIANVAKRVMEGEGLTVWRHP